jgi:hypothetical protein
MLAPPEYAYVLNGNRIAEWETKAARVMGEWASQFLKNWRGYEIFSYEDLRITSKMSSTAEGVEDEFLWQSLFAWADASPVDAVPPPNLMKLIEDLRRHLAVDGVIMIKGHQEIPKSWYSVGKADIKAYILESASGRLVWKNRLVRLSPARPLEQQEVKALFAPLEFAVPLVLVE